MLNPTPHIEVKEEGLIAKTVLMPGDPLRAKYIAETFLENPVQFNGVRGMLGYTGTYKGEKVSVMGSGMGMPSIGIYSYELFSNYGVENIIRIGSCGAYTDQLNLYDVILVEHAYSESSFALAQSGELNDILPASTYINDVVKEVAGELNIPLNIGTIHSSDVFYRQHGSVHEYLFEEKGCIAVEMESFALFHNARVLGKNAGCILTVSDSLVTHEATTSHERQVAFEQMMRIALETALKLNK
ncbi:MAG: purine-nucleoside phosphorylase [Bacilli bacterium]|nr:purine-nucleoside phosphorylase [Bacilli bacterium]